VYPLTDADRRDPTSHTDQHHAVEQQVIAE
jgi:hypothetical protein